MKRKEINIDNELEKLGRFEQILPGDSFTDDILTRISSDRKPERRFSITLAAFSFLVILNILSLITAINKSENINSSRDNNIKSLVEVFSLDK